MKRICMGLLTKDEAYGQRLLAYVRESSYRDIIAPVWYTDAEQCLNRLALEAGPRVLLTDEGIVAEVPDRESLNLADCPLLLLEDEGTGDCPGMIRTVKYQPLNLLLDLVLKSAALQQDQAYSVAGKPERRYILSVYSAVGGAGKTVFTYMAARLLMRMGFRPLVLSLETNPSVCWRFRKGEDDAFGQALFQTGKGKHELLPSPIDRYCISAQQGRLLILPAAENRDELEEMGSEDTVRLIAGAAASSWADIVLIDLDSSLHPRVTASMQQSDKVVCLVPDELIALDKTRGIWGQLEKHTPGLKDKLSLLITKCNGTPSKLAMLEREAEDALPFQPEWQNLSSMEHDLSQPTLYQERLYGWLVRTMNLAGQAPREAIRS